MKRINISLNAAIANKLNVEAKKRGVLLGTYCKTILVSKINNEKYID
jgi:hypothetical protein